MVTKLDFKENGEPMTTSNKPVGQQNRLAQEEPWESVVSHLFAYTLGALDTLTVFRQAKSGAPLEFADLPVGYSLAYSKYDKAAGDAILKRADNWYLLELKRNKQALATEWSKPRVRQLCNEIKTDSCSLDYSLVEVAQTAHQFLYLRKQAAQTRPTLVITSYLNWLLNFEKAHPSSVLDKLKEMSLLDCLTKESFLTEFPGFSLVQLKQYINDMNPSAAGGQGSNDSSLEPEHCCIALALDTARNAMVLTQEQVLSLCQSELDHPPEEKSVSRPKGLGMGGR